MPARTPVCKPQQGAITFCRGQMARRLRLLRPGDARVLLLPGARAEGDYQFLQSLGGAGRGSMAFPRSFVLPGDVPVTKLILHQPLGLDGRHRDLPLLNTARAKARPPPSAPDNPRRARRGSLSTPQYSSARTAATAPLQLRIGDGTRCTWHGQGMKCKALPEDVRKTEDLSARIKKNVSR
jgi:hypothetical protein